jgi:hypothetical protein
VLEAKDKENPNFSWSILKFLEGLEKYILQVFPYNTLNQIIFSSSNVDEIVDKLFTIFEEIKDEYL